MKKIKVAIAGVGNCASSLIQGLEFYNSSKANEYPGLMHPRIGQWGVSDIEIVAAFDRGELWPPSNPGSLRR